MRRLAAWLAWLLLSTTVARAEGTSSREAETRGALAGGDVQAAAAAVDALVTARAVPALLDALAEGLHPDVAVRALNGLVKLADRRADATFLAYARHRHPGVRAAALPGAARTTQGERVVLAALGDSAAEVRAVAIRIAAERRWQKAVPQLVLLLVKKDAPAAAALGLFGNPALAASLVERAAKIPDDLLAQSLAAMLANPKFGKEQDYVELVQTIGRLPGDEPVTVLAAFLGTQPEGSTRPSVKEARRIIEERLGGVK